MNWILKFIEQEYKSILVTVMLICGGDDGDGDDDDDEQ